LHRKPCGLLNVHGFFDPLLSFIDHSINEGFVRTEHRAMVVVSNAADELLQRFEDHGPPIVEKWIDKAET
jgi:predicted Rossmann-fold nucleotide-binding protein